jgi:hypothetical protein
MSEGLGFGTGMIHVEKAKLLEAVKKNREAHRGIFLKAMEGFKKAYIAELERMSQAVIANKEMQLHIALEMPQDHTKDYDKAIAQLEWDTAEVIPINHQQFNNFVLDEWGWSQQFSTSNAAYLGQQ